MSFKNRMFVAGAAGLVSLSIPVFGGRGVKAEVKDVKIDNRVPWQRDHWRTILSCYNRSPWFEHYKYELEILYSTPVLSLIDWNLMTVRWVLPKLEFSVGLGLTDHFQVQYDPEKFVDFRNRFFPRTREADAPSVRYRQVFEDRTGFLPNLSILDLLFCEGPNAGKLLKAAASDRPLLPK